MNNLDVAKREIKIGQTVAFSQNPYADLRLGIVEKFTPKGIKVRPLKDQTDSLFKYCREVAIVSENELL